MAAEHDRNVLQCMGRCEVKDDAAKYNAAYRSYIYLWKQKWRNTWKRFGFYLEPSTENTPRV